MTQEITIKRYQYATPEMKEYNSERDETLRWNDVSELDLIDIAKEHLDESEDTEHPQIETIEQAIDYLGETAGWEIVENNIKTKVENVFTIEQIRKILVKNCILLSSGGVGTTKIVVRCTKGSCPTHVDCIECLVDKFKEDIDA